MWIKEGWEGIFVGVAMLVAALSLLLGFRSSWVDDGGAVLAGEVAMGKVGRFVTDPKAGAYCQIALDNGEKILVNHDKGDLTGGRLTIHAVKWFGFGSSELLLALDLDHPAGRSALARLTIGAQEGSSEATPIGALVAHVKDCRSVDEVRSRCAAFGP